jgi:glycolate oxidase FAD binding subunit
MRREFDSKDDSERLVAAVHDALENHRPLRIRGGDSKAFLGRPVAGDEIDTRSHSGVVTYDPTELVITARAGTPVAELNRVLDAAGQMLPCELPMFSAGATLGGAVASGLSGPRRPWSGSVRDFVLGCRVITGHAKHLRFGGEVMKNVAGYDMSRLLAGSFGCLGIITEVSLKVLPKARQQASLTLEMNPGEALRELSAWRKAALPLSGACHLDGLLHIRLEGASGSVRSALDRIGGTELAATFWDALRDHRLPFFEDTRALWRLSVPNNAPVETLPGAVLVDWAGAQRWLKSDAPASTIRQIAAAAGGHATCFTQLADVDPFHPLSDGLLSVHRRLKQQLDPHGIFNPGRMYADL